MYNVCVYHIIIYVSTYRRVQKTGRHNIIYYYYPRILHVYRRRSMLISRRLFPNPLPPPLLLSRRARDRSLCVRESKSYLQYFEHRTLGEIET